VADDVLITPASRKIEFKDADGNVDAVIQTDSSGNLAITNTGGDVSIGDTTSDVYIGDGTNNVDIVFEQDGEIRGTSGVTVTLGASGATANLAGTVQLGGTTITATATELNYTDGVTSNIQTQLNAKASTSVATTSANGLMSSSDKTKLNGIDTGAEVNQNAFSNVAVSGQTTVAADGKTDTLTLAAGSNVTLTTNATTDTVTISATDTDTVYTLPEATSTVRGGIELFSDTDQSVAANTVTATTGRTYGIQLNSAGQAVVNVPWVDTNTEYTVGDGGLTQNNFTNTLKTKLDGIETSADVTDATNVASAGALMTTGGTMTGDLALGDDDEVRLGDSQDFRMYHDGTNSYLSNKTGSLYIGANDPSDVGGDVYIRAKIGETDTSIRLQDDSGIVFYSNGSVTMQSYSSFLWIYDNTTLQSSADLIFAGGDLIFDRGTYTTTLTSDNPASANQTITFPDATGTVVLDTNLNIPFFQEMC
jgi:hypothetical protein